MRKGKARTKLDLVSALTYTGRNCSVRQTQALTLRFLQYGRTEWTEPRAGIGDRFLVQRFLAPQRVRQERRWSKDVYYDGEL